jgi:hypothetical protein
MKRKQLLIEHNHRQEQEARLIVLSSIGIITLLVIISLK